MTNRSKDSIVCLAELLTCSGDSHSLWVKKIIPLSRVIKDTQKKKKTKGV